MTKQTIKGLIVNKLLPTFLIVLLQISSVMLLPFSVLAEEGDEEAEEITARFTTYLSEDEKFLTSIHTFIQDEQNILWTGNSNGLSKFSGIKFERFTNKSHSKQDATVDDIKAFTKDQNGTVWFGGGSGIGYINKDTGNVFQYDLKDYNANDLTVRDMLFTDDNRLMIGGSNGLWEFNITEDKIIKIKTNQLSIFTLKHDHLGNLWIGTYQGLYKKDANSTKVEQINSYPQINATIRDLEIKNDILWVVSDESIEQLDLINHKWNLIANYRHFSSAKFRDIQFVNDEIWLTTDGYLWKKNIAVDDWTKITILINGKATNVLGLYQMYLDSQSQLWISSIDGLLVWNPNHQVISTWLKKIIIVNKSGSKSSKKANITSIHKSFNNIWVSTDGQGLFKLNEFGEITESFDYLNIPGLRANDIYSVIADTAGRLWLSTSGNSLIMRNSKGKWTVFLVEQSKGSEINVYDIYEDRGGRVWYSHSEGIGVYNEKTDEIIDMTYLFPQNVKNRNQQVSVIYQAQDGNYWFGTDSGLIVYDEELQFLKLLNFEVTNNSFQNLVVTDIAEDATGNIWITSNAGLNKISSSNNEFNVFSFNHFSSGFLFLVELDTDGNVWFGGSEGLMRYNPTTDELLKIPKEYGLQGWEYNSDASFQDEAGVLYFGGTNGINRIDPKTFPLPSFHPPILLTEVKLNGFTDKNTISNSADGSYFIPSDTKVARFYFDIVDLDSASSYALRIRIPERSDEWFPWTDKRHFDFFDLPTGNITLQVQSKNLITAKIIDDKKFKLEVESRYSYYDYFLWLALTIVSVLLLFFLRRMYQGWTLEKESLLRSQLKLSTTIGDYQTELKTKQQEHDQLLDELATSLKEKMLLESQMSELHLVDKHTGLHTRDFIRLSIETAARQLMDAYNAPKATLQETKLPKLLLLLIKLDGFESLRLEGGQFLLNQIIIQIAAEIKSVSLNADEIVRWNKDSFLLLSRAESKRQILKKCERIVRAVNTGEFGPSASEKLPITCSLSCIKFPFFSENPSKTEWGVLLDLANSSACYMSEQGGNRYMLLTENLAHDSAQFEVAEMEQLIDNFGAVGEKLWLTVTTSKT